MMSTKQLLKLQDDELNRIETDSTDNRTQHMLIVAVLQIAIELSCITESLPMAGRGI